MARLYTSTSFRPIINERLDPFSDEKKEVIIVGRTKKEHNREGSEGLLDIGVVCEKQASGQSYHGYRVLMDAKFPHIIFICGKRGGGKSYTLGVMAEELSKTRIGIGTVIVDPIGIYWSMKKKNQSKKEIAELEKWGLKPKALDNVRILGPLGLYDPGSGVLDGPFSIKPAELTSEDWCLVFGLDRFKIQGLLIGEGLEKVRDGYKIRKGPNEVEFIPGKGTDYEIEDIVDAIDRDVDLGSEDRGYARTTRRSIIARFKAAERWGIFSQQGTPIEEISVWDTVTVIDVSHPKLENQIRALIVGILAKKILQARMFSSRSDEIGLAGEGSRIPVTWLMIDEAHLLIPRRGLTAASKPLIEFAKLGRKPGCALVLATQRPAATDDDILSQIDILIGHSLGLEDDIAALLKRVPAKLPAQMAASDFIRAIPSGFGLLADQKTQQRTMLVQIRPRLTHHSGKEAMPAKQVIPPRPPIVKPATSVSENEVEAPEIKSIWGVEAGTTTRPEGDAGAEEEFEIVSASEAISEFAEGEAIRAEPEEVPEEYGSSFSEDLESQADEDEGIETIPEITLGTEDLDKDERPVYADGAIMQRMGFDQPDYEEWPETETEDVPTEESGEEEIGLASLSEEVVGEEPEVEPEEHMEETQTKVFHEPRPLLEGEVDSFPVILRRDSAKGLSIKGLKTGWGGKPKEFVESIELVHLPMFEASVKARKKSFISGKVVVKCRILFDIHTREIVTDFYEFKRSKGLRRLVGLGEEYLKIISCIIEKKIPENCEHELDMKGEKIREAMTELSEKGIINISEDKKGYLKGSLSKEIKFPNKPENVKGQLPSSNPTRVAHLLDERMNQESFEGLIQSIYPGYNIESFHRIYMPYYEVTYASENDSRKEHINAFTGLFEDLSPE